MRPSHPHHPGGYSGSAAGQQYMGARIPHGVHQRIGQHNIKYYPSLSGSETDVSTSTENLTQEERYVLRNMERQEPQGEEQHHPVSHQQAAMGHLSAVPHSVLANHLLQSHSQQGPSYHPPPPYSDRLIAQQIASNNAKREALRLDAMIAASRQGTPIGTPVPHAGGGLRTDELYGARMSGGTRFTPASHYQTITSMPQINPQEANLSRLAPSVYSHPIVTDPLLKSPKSFYQDPSVLLPKKGFNVSSSGAYFDASAVSKESELQAQNDIIAQLTREMRLNNNGHLSGGSDVESSGSTSTLNNPAATAERIAALAFQAKHNPVSNIPVPVSKPAKPTESQPKSGWGTAAPVVSGSSSTSSPSKAVLDAAKDSPSKLKLAEGRKMSVPTSAGGLALSVKPDNLPLLSYSQPDLANLSASEAKVSTSIVAQLGSPDVAPQSAQDMVEIVINENRELKSEVDAMRRKISRLDNLEKEMMKIHEAYQALREHSEKREILEKSARTKLQAEILNHQEINKEIRERHDAVMAQIMSGDTSNIPGLDSILRGEILRKDALISQLANQNKELLASKERQEIECAEQRETLQEQRTHIDVLDSALSNAQNNVLRLEEELRQKEAYAERVKQMTKSLEQLQAASEKREAMEKKLRAKLEEELKELRTEQESRVSREGEEDIEALARKLSESEEKIIRLESERTQWEQRYLEESAMRQVAIDAASIPKDAKIAVLEKNSAESEKKIAEARSEKMKQIAEVQQCQRRIVELEMKLKSVETSMAEKNAMIKVLQKRAFEKPGDGENVLSIPIHDSLPSSNSILHSKQLSTSHIGSPLSHMSGNHSSQHSTPIPFSISHGSQHSTPLPFTVSHASQHSTPLPFTVSHASQHSSPVPFTASHPTTLPYSHNHSQQLSMSLLSHNSSQHASSLPLQVSHASQHSTPITIGSPRHTVTDFYDGISPAMSSTARGPLSKLGLGGRVRSGSPAHVQRSATPSDLLRSSTPTREAAKHNRRDSAPSEVHSLSESPGKTLINTSDLYSTGASVSSGGTLPKMSFAMMKEENSRTMPSKTYATLAESLRDSYPNDPNFSDRSTKQEGKAPESAAANQDAGKHDRPADGVKFSTKASGSGSAKGTPEKQSNESSRCETTVLDDSVNSSLLNKDSLLLALKQEKEKRPENFWRV